MTTPITSGTAPAMMICTRLVGVRSSVGSSTRVDSPPKRATRSLRSSTGVTEAGVSTAMTGQVIAPQKRSTNPDDTDTP